MCPSCGERCTVDVLSSGFDESEYLYCDRCSGVALLDFYAGEAGVLARLGKDRWWRWRASAADMASIEAALRTCECGGHFRFSAVPRCPKCGAGFDLAAVKGQLGAGEWWRADTWRPSDDGYCLIIDGRSIRNPFRQ